MTTDHIGKSPQSFQVDSDFATFSSHPFVEPLLHWIAATRPSNDGGRSFGYWADGFVETSQHPSQREQRRSTRGPVGMGGVPIRSPCGVGVGYWLGQA